MKHFFEEPKLQVEQFAVTDVLTASSWLDNVKRGDDEIGILTPFSSANWYGN